MSTDERSTGGSPLATAEFGPRGVRPSPWSISARQNLRIIAAFILVFVGGYGVMDYVKLRELHDDGVSVSAVVTDKERVIRTRDDFRLNYSYELGGQTVTGTHSVSAEEYDDTHDGDSLPITALPLHPKTHVYGPVSDAAVAKAKFGWLVITVGLAGLFELWAGILGIATRRQMAILRDHVAVPAVCSEIGPTSGFQYPRTEAIFTYYPPQSEPLQLRISVSEDEARDLQVGQTTKFLVHPKSKFEVQPLADMKLAVLETTA